MTIPAALAPTSTRPPAPDVAAVFAAALDLRSFTGTVGIDQLRSMLQGAGLGPSWLSGRRWHVLRDLWTRRATAAEAARAITDLTALPVG